MQKSHFWFQVEILWILGANREPKGGQNEVKRHQKINLFLVVFLEGSKSLILVASGPRKPHFRQRIPAAAPYSKITILTL